MLLLPLGGHVACLAQAAPGTQSWHSLAACAERPAGHCCRPAVHSASGQRQPKQVHREAHPRDLRQARPALLPGVSRQNMCVAQCRLRGKASSNSAVLLLPELLLPGCLAPYEAHCCQSATSSRIPEYWLRRFDQVTVDKPVPAICTNGSYCEGSEAGGGTCVEVCLQAASRLAPASGCLRLRRNIHVLRPVAAAAAADALHAPSPPLFLCAAEPQ